MYIDRTVGLADWPQTEVVGPADHHPIEPSHDRLRIRPDFVTPGLVADRSTDALYSFLRGYRAEIDSAPPHRVTPPERVSQKIKLLFRQITDPRLVLVHRQLQLRHHHPHRGQSLIGADPTADDKVIGIVHDVRFPTLLVPEFLPAQHEPSHVQIAEQRTDRGSLRSPSTFIPIARAPMRVSMLVRFLDRSFQPHLDQMQHRSIDDPASHRPHKLGVWNTIKVAAEIRINDLPMSRVDQLVDVLYCVQRAAVRPIGILLRLQVSLEDRFENQHCRHLRNPIPDCWYS